MDQERNSERAVSNTGETSEYMLETGNHNNALSVNDTEIGSLTAAMHSGLGIASPFTKEIFLTKQAIVGMRFQGGSDDLMDDLEPGSRITFIREPENRFDEKAIMALDEKGRKLGYIPRLNNTILSALMDAGKFLYGIVSDEPKDKNAYGGHTPAALYVDLYLREFSLPDDLTQIPRQGYRGSYAVIDMDITDDPEDTKVCSVFVIKVINGEERGLYFDMIPDDREPDEEDFEKLILGLQAYIGYLPLVGYHIYGKQQEALENAWGVHTGRPFSNQVIDIREMAWNRFQNNWEQSLEGLAKRLGITVDCDTPEETRCRQILQIYCRFDRSELEKKSDIVTGSLTKEKYRSDLEMPISEIRMTQHLRETLEEKGIDILWEMSNLKRHLAYKVVGEENITELEELLQDADSGFMPEENMDLLYAYPETIQEIATERNTLWKYLLLFEAFGFRYRQLRKVRHQATNLGRKERSSPSFRTLSDFISFTDEELGIIIKVLDQYPGIINRFKRCLEYEDDTETVIEICGVIDDLIFLYKKLMGIQKRLRKRSSAEPCRDIIEDLANTGEQLCKDLIDSLYQKTESAKKNMYDYIGGKTRIVDKVDLSVQISADFVSIKKKVKKLREKYQKE